MLSALLRAAGVDRGRERQRGTLGDRRHRHGCFRIVRTDTSTTPREPLAELGRASWRAHDEHSFENLRRLAFWSLERGLID